MTDFRDPDTDMPMGMPPGGLRDVPLRRDYEADASEDQRQKDQTPHATRLSAVALDALNRTSDPQERTAIEMVLLNLSLLKPGQDITEASALDMEARLAKVGR